MKRNIIIGIVGIFIIELFANKTLAQDTTFINKLLGKHIDIICTDYNCTPSSLGIIDCGVLFHLKVIKHDNISFNILYIPYIDRSTNSYPKNLVLGVLINDTNYILENKYRVGIILNNKDSTINKITYNKTNGNYEIKTSSGYLIHLSKIKDDEYKIIYFLKSNLIK
jgi:hypothetical protein